MTDFRATLLQFQIYKVTVKKPSCICGSQMNGYLQDMQQKRHLCPLHHPCSLQLFKEHIINLRNTLSICSNISTSLPSTLVPQNECRIIVKRVNSATSLFKDHIINMPNISCICSKLSTSLPSTPTTQNVCSTLVTHLSSITSSKQKHDLKNTVGHLQTAMVCATLLMKNF